MISSSQVACLSPIPNKKSRPDRLIVFIRLEFLVISRKDAQLLLYGAD